MTRTQLINFLVRQRNAKRYLEIGTTGKDNHFDSVDCQYRVCVSNNPGASFRGSSNDYFRQHREKFDLIFIDGHHTEEQALKDIDNAFHRLAPGGVIIIHDCMPPDKWHQRGPEAFKEGENWTGTVWKAVLRTFNRSLYKCTLLDTDWGCGIIDTASTQTPVCRDLPEELDYAVHYEWLLTYKTSVAAYLPDHVKVFYHLACIGNWKEVFMEQMSQLEQHGFEWIDVTVLGSETDLQSVYSFFQELNVKASVIFHRSELTLFEKPALIAVQEYARQHEGYVLYLHSKGVSNPGDGSKTKWRRLMMDELVVNHEYCKMQLPQYDLIGVNWRDMPPISHFCGNFWYASTQYLRKLPDFKQYYDNPRYKIWDTINSKRLGCEFWIGSFREMPRILSLAYRNVDFCNPGFWENKHN